MSEGKKTIIDTDTDTESKEDELDLDDIDLDNFDLDEEEEDEASSDGSEEESEKEAPKGESDSAINIQRKKWRDRAKAAEAKLFELQQTKTKTASKKVESDPIKQERTDFRFDHPELLSKEVNEIEALARAKGITLSEAMRSPIIKIFLKATARKREHSQASPETRHRSAPRAKGKDPMEMTTEEFEAFKRQVKSGAFSS